MSASLMVLREVMRSSEKRYRSGGLKEDSERFEG